MRSPKYSTVFLPLLIFISASGRIGVQAAKVIAIGDSYSSGTGIYSGFSGYDEWLGGKINFHGSDYSFTTAKPASCWRETKTSPGPKLAEDLGMDFVMGACWGADIQNLYDQVDYLNVKYPEETVTGWDGSTIILTLGLNDLRSISDDRWGEVLLRCVFGPFKDCTENADNIIGNGEQIRKDLTAAFSHLAAFANRSKIRVLGYGRLFQRNGGDCSGAFGVSNAEADLLDHEWFDGMNDISKQTVVELKLMDQALDIEFVDVTSYLTIGSCAKEGRHLNGLFDTLPLGSYHPSKLGYDQYYRALQDNLLMGE